MFCTYHFLGVAVIWWIAWFALFILSLFIFIPIMRKNAKDTPIDILQKRFSKGEISVIEYEKRKRVLEKDSDLKIRQYLVSRHAKN